MAILSYHFGDICDFDVNTTYFTLSDENIGNHHRKDNEHTRRVCTFNTHCVVSHSDAFSNTWY